MHFDLYCIMKNALIFFFFLIISTFGYSQAFLSSPVDGQEIEDFTIVNYVDWSFQDSIDHQCGSKTYDGHQGTDLVLKSFVEMDVGFNILAAADGEVTFVLDGLFDRETISDPAKGLGNYIAIRHDNDYYSYYGHLKKNSILVDVGQFVQAGDVIAQLGSSGNSTDPHLHFELWYDSLEVVDPFQGDCGNAQTLWLDEFSYETDFRIWESGLADYLLAIDSLKERAGLKDCCPFLMNETQTKPTIYWAQIIGLRQGDQLKIQWFTPQNQLWFEYELDIEKDWWYYYYWTYIDPGMLEQGVWNVKLFRNEIEEDQIEFTVDNTISVSNIFNGDCTNLSEDEIEKVEIYTFSGKLISENSYSGNKNLPVFEKLFLKNGEICFRKKMMLFNY